MFTHCGKQIVEGDRGAMPAEVPQLGHDRGVEAKIAFDGLSFRD